MGSLPTGSRDTNFGSYLAFASGPLRLTACSTAVYSLLVHGGCSWKTCVRESSLKTIKEHTHLRSCHQCNDITACVQDACAPCRNAPEQPPLYRLYSIPLTNVKRPTKQSMSTCIPTCKHPYDSKMADDCKDCSVAFWRFHGRRMRI